MAATLTRGKVDSRAVPPVNILLIATTGWSQAEDRERTREAGFDSHMVKPLEADALVELLAARAKDAQPAR